MILDMRLSVSDCLLVYFVDLFVREQWKRRSCSSKKKRKIWPNRFCQDLETLSPSSPWLTSKSFLASNCLFLGLSIVPLLVCIRTWGERPNHGPLGSPVTVNPCACHTVRRTQCPEWGASYHVNHWLINRVNQLI